jgi:hypothetical protein
MKSIGQDGLAAHTVRRFVRILGSMSGYKIESSKNDEGERLPNRQIAGEVSVKRGSGSRRGQHSPSLYQPRPLGPPILRKGRLLSWLSALEHSGLPRSDEYCWLQKRERML